MEKQRYFLQPSQDEGWYVLTDAEYGIVCKFQKGHFNDSFDVTPLDGKALLRLSPLRLAGLMREMCDWANANCPELLHPQPEPRKKDAASIENRKRIGKRIEELRQSRGLSYRELADMCGLNASNLSKIEKGRYATTIDILNKIADALGAKIEIN